jgi:hypothetical protein
MINISVKIPAKPATPESLEEWTSEKIRLQFGNEPEGLVMRLLDLCETQATEILALKNMIRECETDFLNYSRNSERSTEEITKLQNKLNDCNELHKETRDKILGAIGIHEIKKH